jgi:hypothetical protein
MAVPTTSEGEAEERKLHRALIAELQLAVEIWTESCVCVRERVLHLAG